MKKNTVLITGASSGLGEAFARYCASQGCHLALVARRLEKLEQLAEQLRERYAIQVEVAQLDINEHQKILPIFMGLSDLLGGIDTVMINAGITKVRRLADERLDKDIDIFNTNVIAAIACSDAAQKMFQIQGGGGHLMAISSYSAFMGLPPAAAYSASKAAVASYFNAIRSALYKRKITLSVIYPGFVQTDLLKGFNSALPIIAKADDVAKQMYDVMLKKKAEAIVPPLPWKVLYGLQQMTPKPVLRWVSRLL
jgi:short-subunit dehydrogenase